MAVPDHTGGPYSTSNQYIVYRIIAEEIGTNEKTNTSGVRVTVQARRTNSEAITNYAGSCNVKVGDKTGSSSWAYNAHPLSTSWVQLYRNSFTITHNDDGTKAISIQAKFQLTSGGTTKVSSSYHGFTYTLSNLDRTPPVVSVVVGNISVNGFNISATASGDNNTCDLWDYSINNGVDWTPISVDPGTSASVSVTGLLPNTVYNTIVRARKVNNEVYGESEPQAVQTLGNAVLNSVEPVVADSDTVTLSFNTTVYVASYTHKLELKNGNTLILAFSGLSLNNGNNSLTLSSAQRSQLLTAMSGLKSFTGTFELTTYNGSTQIGFVSRATALVQTSAASAPTFTGFTYLDSNTVSSTVTGDNQILIQGISVLNVTAAVATAKNGATIAGYSVSAGSTTKQSVSNVIGDVGVISSSGTIALTVSAIDSRGYSTSRTVNVTVIPYEKIKIDNYLVRRVNEVEDDVDVTFNGTISEVKINNVAKNNQVTARYRYRKTSEAEISQWYDMTNPSPSLSGSSFSYENSSLNSLDANYSWYLEFEFKDRLTSESVSAIIAQGIPLMSYRQKKVGINKREPTKALDVNGDVAISGGTSISGELQVLYTGVRAKQVRIRHETSGNMIAYVGYRSDGSGSWSIYDSNGNANAWCNGNSGQINSRAMHLRSSGDEKNRIINKVDGTDKFGVTTWYDGNSTPKEKVIISGSADENIKLLDDNGNTTINLDSDTGKITCAKMSYSDGTATFSKSSGSWSFSNGKFTRSGQVVQLFVQFKGGGSNVSVGSNAIAGTISGIPLPPYTIRLQGYYSGTMLMGELTTSGAFNVRILGAALNLATSNTATMSGTYITEE
ncbi:MAG: hypothetical protein J6Y02_21695 [Pseudobutyrivibrio sp.]|nr:hypothetical protein [Pseudobutyrivibrio sp.]